MSNHTIGIAIVFFLILYLVFCPKLNHALYTPLLFHPEPLARAGVEPPLIGDCQGENVYFTSQNGQRLNGWYYKNAKGHVTVIFNHGNGGNITYRLDLIKLLAEARRFGAYL